MMNSTTTLNDTSSQASGDTSISALLEMFNKSGGGVDLVALLKSQLESMAELNPQLALILNILEQQKELQAQTEIPEEDNDDDMQDIQQSIDHMSSEIETLRMRNDILAGALGACYLCFGDDESCRYCGGRGAPGWRPPDRKAFRKFILPAVRRAQAIDTSRNKHIDHSNVEAR